MADRATKIEHFLAAAGVEAWAREPIAVDASSRRYLRLRHKDRSLILMDSPPINGESIIAFTKIARHLQSIGLSAPKIESEDAPEGFVLLEDLGAEHVADHLRARPQDEGQIYCATVDAILHLQSNDTPIEIGVLGPNEATDLARLYGEWCAPSLSDDVFEALRLAWASLEPYSNSVSLRDLHAENIIWRPALRGLDQIGLLDFQDAVLTHPVYDLVSLLRDARRRVGIITLEVAKQRFIEGSGMDRAAFDKAFAVISAQRALRILGVFERLITRDSKPKYAAFVPRVTAYLRQDLAHPALGEVAKYILPELDRHV